MELNPLPIFALLCFVLVGSHASLPSESEMYWQTMLPNTPIPTALQQLLLPTDIRDQSTYTDNNSIDVPMGPPRYVFLPGEENAIANGTTFFKFNDLRPGKRMSLLFTKTIYKARFLPREVAESIPFSSDKLTEILSWFSVKPESIEAKNIKGTIKDCEIPKIKGEDKYCASSLESLVDYITAKIGKKVKVLSTEVEKESSDFKKQEYEILEGIKKIGDKQVVCHKERYAYALFLCHTITPSKSYMVPLIGSDGSKVQAVAICHLDSSAWSPEHYAFKVLNVKPGATICHFLNSDPLVWIPTSKHQAS